MKNLYTLIRYNNIYIQPLKFTASPGVIAWMEEKSPVDLFLLFFSSKILQLIHTRAKSRTMAKARTIGLVL